MCGIAGIFNYDSPEESSVEVNVKKMLSLIKHRGPDESGVLVDKALGIGSVRLSIIDLSTGQQPMSDITGKYWIVYNGEIFNYLEIRAELLKKGIQFRTNCDTEVVLQSYIKYGADCLNRFNGQFAFCIWDKDKRELFLARDRVGIRPLFYWTQNDTFAFCSEIKGLFSLHQIEKAIDTESLSQIFTFWTTLTPNTPFKNIKELSPGYYMYVNQNGIKTTKYWSMSFKSGNEHTTCNPDNSIEKLDELLHDAVKIRLRADVPIGAYLSGGLDSSVITSYINKIYPEILNTFSIGFTDKDYDETSFQVEASNFFNTNHTAYVFTAEELATNFAQTIWHTEFPILRTSPTPMLMLAKKVRESNIKVVLTGEGADEFLAGYNIFKETKIRRFWANEPNSIIRPKLLGKLYPYIPLMKESPDLALKMFYGYKLRETDNPTYSHLIRWNNTGRLKSFFSDEITTSLNVSNPLEIIHKNLPDDFNQWSSLAKSQYLEATIFMSGYLLSSQGDRMAMGNSVEGRYPFLDYRVIEFCNNIPDNQKLNCLNEKYILKKLSKERIPSSISQRSKQAYRTPISSIFETLKTQNILTDLLSNHTIKAYGFFNAQKVQNLIKKLKQETIPSELDQMALVGILSTQLLHKSFIVDQIDPDYGSLNNYRLTNIS